MYCGWAPRSSPRLRPSPAGPPHPHPAPPPPFPLATVKEDESTRRRIQPPPLRRSPRRQSNGRAARNKSPSTRGRLRRPLFLTLRHPRPAQTFRPLQRLVGKIRNVTRYNWESEARHEALSDPSRHYPSLFHDLWFVNP